MPASWSTRMRAKHARPWPPAVRRASSVTPATSATMALPGPGAVPLLAALLPTLLLTLLSGCTCQPLLDVDACFDDRRDCTSAKDVVTWDATLAQRWPDLDALIQNVGEGEHDHRPWHGDGDALLGDLSADMDTRTAWVEHEGRLYRVRQPIC